MITRDNFIKYFGSLIEDMFSEGVAEYFGFSEDKTERYWYGNLNQNPRDAVQTMIYYTVRNGVWKSERAVVTKYLSDGSQYSDEMRQVILSIDVVSKVNPIGTAQDVIHYITSKLQGDYLEQWQTAYPEKIFALEGFKTYDLTALLQTETWCERQRIDIRFNFRDNIVLDKTDMTRIPTSIDDLHESVDFSINTKE